MKYILKFPRGGPEITLDKSYCQTPLAIGELIFFEGELATYRISDIQHQLRRGEHVPVEIMTIVILKSGG